MKHAENPSPHSLFHTPLHHGLRQACAAVLAGACLLGASATAVHAQAPVQVQSYGEVNQLLKDGQGSQALAKAEAYIAKNPRDVQMRFLRGVILSELGKREAATEAFTQLTRDFPELPEPYNNLAALYAAQGQYDKAREALETALRLNPNYATAHENLGDVYARLAAQQYARAGQFASASKGVQLKLDHVRQLFEEGAAKAPRNNPSKPPARPAAEPAQPIDTPR